MDGEELSDQETALYDHQIRVWDADAQRRLSKSHILISRLKDSVIEFCENIVLSRGRGKSLAELYSDSLKEFNRMKDSSNGSLDFGFSFPYNFVQHKCNQ
ncbi:hypothetical protein C2S52_005178 [Perilla frutescens var. hirtella]|nr:hypothetical protein C2S52_005178 [Perilla frutescens var. hirtella]